MRVFLGMIFVGTFAGAGCHLIVGLGPIDEGPGIGMGGVGGMQLVCDPVVCDALDEECLDFACNGGNTECDNGTLIAANSPCLLTTDNICTVDGECVTVCDPFACDMLDQECLDFSCNERNTGCDTGTVAAEGTDCDNGSGPGSGTCDSAGICLPKGCTNGVMDGDETAVDCGGICNVSVGGKCHNSITCTVHADCKSNVCNNNICEPCTGASECEAGNYCNVENTQGQGGTGGGDPTRGAICEPTKPSSVGEMCGNSGGDEECTDGNCVDGFCCNTACNGDCASCALFGTEGICTPHPAGTDPEADCMANMSYCRQADCNGTMGVSACDVANGTVCINAWCNGSVEVTQGTCTSGTCMGSMTNNCFPYTCGATACNTSCTNSAQCASGNYCNVGGSCVPQFAQGQACVGWPPDECMTGNCADGVCCSALCNATCQSCLMMDTGMANGTCGNVIFGTNPTDSDTMMTECTAPQVCDGSSGNNSCKLPSGATSCAGNSDCLSNICNDESICCNAVCDGPCQTCGGGICSQHAAFTDPEMSMCSLNNSCDGVGGCRLDPDQPCTAHTQCITNWCDLGGTNNCELCTMNSDCPSNSCDAMNGVCAP